MALPENVHFLLYNKPLGIVKEEIFFAVFTQKITISLTFCFLIFLTYMSSKTDEKIEYSNDLKTKAEPKCSNVAPT